MALCPWWKIQWRKKRKERKLNFLWKRDHISVNCFRIYICLHLNLYPPFYACIYCRPAIIGTLCAFVRVYTCGQWARDNNHILRVRLVMLRSVITSGKRSIPITHPIISHHYVIMVTTKTQCNQWCFHSKHHRSAYNDLRKLQCEN